MIQFKLIKIPKTFREKNSNRGKGAKGAKGKRGEKGDKNLLVPLLL